MFRKDLIELLLDHPRSVAELARMLEMKPKDVEHDLGHLLRSLRASEYRAVVEPAECRHCGFAFRRDKLGKPGKCPRCKQTWIREPRLRVEHRGRA